MKPILFDSLKKITSLLGLQLGEIAGGATRGARAVVFILTIYLIYISYFIDLEQSRNLANSTLLLNFNLLHPVSQPLPCILGLDLGLQWLMQWQRYSAGFELQTQNQLATPSKINKR